MFDSPNVDLCRSNLKHISLAYHKTPSANLKVQLESAKLELENAYLTAKEGFLLDKIADLESFHANNSHHEAWNVIKDISDSGLNSSIQIKGGSSESSSKAGFKPILKAFSGRKPTFQVTTFYLLKLSLIS